ncbi:F-box/RNI-like superfamily protein, partial [Tanacetum coccineum]
MEKPFPALKELNTFHDFVDQTLSIRANVAIESLFLQFERKCDYDRIYDMLCAFVLQCKVQKLEIKFPNENYKVRFCWDLFKTWDSLFQLNLEGGFVLDVPEDELLFPCLKRLQLACVGYFKDCSVTNLVSGCPVLEDLFVERDVYPDNLEMFKVSSVSLKNLWIAFNRFVTGDFLKVVIDAPKLEYLYV